MSADDSVLAVCVNFNGGGQLIDTIRALRESDFPRLSILIADNASTDGSDLRLHAEFSDIPIWRLERNLGYGGALNLVVNDRMRREASPAYFLAMNNDVTVSASMVGALVAEAQRRGPGVYGPRILQAGRPSQLEAAWGKVTWDHVAARFIGQGEPADSPRWGQVSEVELLLGTVLLIHQDVFRRVGGFDPRFFMYHEEVDFLYRVRGAGFPVVYCPQATVEHEGGLATRDRPHFKLYWTRRNAVLFLRKHRAGAAWAWYGATLLASLAWNLARLRPGRVRTIWAGVRDGFRIPLADSISANANEGTWPSP